MFSYHKCSGSQSQSLFRLSDISNFTYFCLRGVQYALPLASVKARTSSNIAECMWLHVHSGRFIRIVPLLLLLLNFTIYLWKVERAEYSSYASEMLFEWRNKTGWWQWDRAKQKQALCDRSFILTTSVLVSMYYYFPYSLIYFHIISYFISNLWNLLET